MKARPILFSTPMIQALLEGRKTQTRRIVKPQPTPITDEDDFKWRTNEKVYGNPPYWWASKGCEAMLGIHEMRYDCPYGSVGDLLWVRETFCIGEIAAGDHDPAEKEPLFVDQSSVAREEVVYKEYCISNDIGIEEVIWKPSIFMPKSASRLTLEITNIRVERLQDISKQDAIAEGIEYESDSHITQRCKNYISGGRCPDPIFSYHTLWQKLNGKDSWAKNEWMWVIEFKVHKCNFQQLIKD